MCFAVQASQASAHVEHPIRQEASANGVKANPCHTQDRPIKAAAWLITFYTNSSSFLSFQHNSFSPPDSYSCPITRPPLILPFVRAVARAPSAAPTRHRRSESPFIALHPRRRALPPAVRGHLADHVLHKFKFFPEFPALFPPHP